MRLAERTQRTAETTPASIYSADGAQQSVFHQGCVKCWSSSQRKRDELESYSI